MRSPGQVGVTRVTTSQNGPWVDREWLARRIEIVACAYKQDSASGGSSGSFGLMRTASEQT